MPPDACPDPNRRLFWRWRRWASVVLSVGVGVSALAQTPPDPAASAPASAPVAAAPASAASTPAPALSLTAQIDALTNQLASTSLTPAQQSEVKDDITAATASLTNAASQRTQAAELRSHGAAAATPATAKPVSPEVVAERFTRWRTEMESESNIPALERLLVDERSATTRLRERSDQAATQLAELLAQPARLSDELVTLRQRTDELTNTPQGTSNEPSLVQRAQAVRRSAEKEQIDAEIELRRAEQDTAGARQNALELQLQELQQELALREPRSAWLNQRIAQLSRQRLRDQADAAKTLSDELAKQQDAPPVLVDLARTNATMAQALMQDTEGLTKDRVRRTGDEQLSERISGVLRDAQARLNLGGNSAATGHWLWQQRLEMPSLRALERQRRVLLQNLSDLRLRQYALADQRRAALNPALGNTTSQAATGATSEPVSAAATMDSGQLLELARLRNQQSHLSSQLTPLLAQRVTVLEQEDRLLATIIDRGGQLRDLMDRELLWVPSHAPINLAWLKALPAQLLDGLKGVHLSSVSTLLLADMQRHPLGYAFYGLLLIALWRLRRLASRRLGTLAARTRDVLHDHFSNTVEALFWSCVIALPWPFTVAGMGLLLRGQADGHASDVETLGETLIFIGGLGLMLALLHALIRPNGLAEAHLRWGQRRLGHMRRAWLAVSWLLIPTSFMALWPMRRGVDVAIDTHARLAVMLIGVGMGLIAMWLMRRERLWPNMPEALHRVLGVVLPAGYFLSTLAAAAGYVYTATTLIDALLKTALVIVLAQTIYGMLDRWLLLGERALALKSRQGVAQHAKEVVDQESSSTPRDDDVAAIELVSVSAQGRRLMKVVRIAILLIGLTVAWGEVAPALLRFDNIDLWHFSDKAADGKLVTGVVTASDLMIALLVGAVTFSLVRNIPGLVELALSASHRITASTRYTVTMLLRYAVIVIGAVSALQLLGVRWSQLQWMAAALTVGLGFGLQEIFANFVSGLILLVERPFRVGDTITIGNVSGTVTRIRTRATVVLDFDNKENVIPNKTFITGQVVNWTLSDDVTRVSIPVGVAYGTPVQRVHNLLLQVASEQPEVMKEPEPRSWFLALGGSTLNFELRVYVDGLGNRLLVQNALLGRIAELFQSEGIEIAFPQMDVHVRDWPPITAPVDETAQPPVAPPAGQATGSA